MAVVPSVVITIIVSIVLEIDFQGFVMGITLSAMIPGFLAPVLSYNYLKLYEKLEEAHKQVIFLSRRDNLTGIFNRSYTYELAEREIGLAHRHHNPLSVMMIDIDHFKAINDQFGHQAGDQVLIQIASLIRTELRDSDILGRYGGEEFVALLPHSDSTNTFEVAERIRESVATSSVLAGEANLRITISIGFKVMDDQAKNMDSLVSCADKALYVAKNTGRNIVVNADELSDELA